MTCSDHPKKPATSKCLHGRNEMGGYACDHNVCEDHRYCKYHLFETCPDQIKILEGKVRFWKQVCQNTRRELSNLRKFVDTNLK